MKNKPEQTTGKHLTAFPCATLTDDLKQLANFRTADYDLCEVELAVFPTTVGFNRSFLQSILLIYYIIGYIVHVPLLKMCECDNAKSSRKRQVIPLTG